MRDKVRVAQLPYRHLPSALAGHNSAHPVSACFRRNVSNWQLMGLSSQDIDIVVDGVPALVFASQFVEAARRARIVTSAPTVVLANPGQCKRLDTNIVSTMGFHVDFVNPRNDSPASAPGNSNTVCLRLCCHPPRVTTCPRQVLVCMGRVCMCAPYSTKIALS